MAYKILLVEDDADFGFMLQQYLAFADMTVVWLQNPLELAATMGKEGDFDMAIFDVMLPHISGFELARSFILDYPDFPFLFLTAKDQRIDKLSGLKIGAIDYMTKPCDPEELVLRIKNIVRRSAKKVEKQGLLHIGTYTFDHRRLLLKPAAGESIRLTEREASLLAFLWENRGSLLTREQILEKVWGHVDFFTGRSMDVFISRLRKHLQQDDRIKISSVRAVGFEIRFNV